MPSRGSSYRIVRNGCKHIIEGDFEAKGDGVMQDSAVPIGWRGGTW